MHPLLGLPYVVHVLSGLFWVGAVLYVAYALVPAPEDTVEAAGLGLALDKLLRGTRWTGVALSVTGLHQVWVLYPVDRLLGTTRGHLVVGMVLLWEVMNDLVELGIYRARTVDGTRLSLGTYMAEGVRADGGLPAGSARDSLSTVRTCLAVATCPSVLLAVDAALLGGGLAALSL
jgi:uncharacterized membrane protein